VVGYFIITLLEIYCQVCVQRISKIGQQLAKLEAKIQWQLFSGHSVDTQAVILHD